MVGVVALAHQQPGQERPDGQAHTRQRDGPRRPQADRRDGQQEQLGPPRLGDAFQKRRDHAPRADQDRRDHQDRLPQRPRDVAGRPALARQRRDQEHHHHDDQVLEQDHRQHYAADGRVGLAPLAQHLEHDGRGRERDQEAREHGRAYPNAQEHQPAGDDPDGEPHLEPAAQEDRPSQPRHLTQRELDADGKQQQDHADLGKLSHQAHVADQPQGLRPDQHAGQQKPGDRDQPDPVAQVRHHHAGCE